MPGARASYAGGISRLPMPTMQDTFPIASRPSSRLLLIEADPNARALLVASLERWNHTVSCADLPTVLGQPSLLARSAMLLLDPTAPLGWRTLRRVRERAPRLPVMAMLPGDDYFDRVLALESGADAVIAKPVDLRELHARILSLLARSREAAVQPQEEGVALRFGRWRLDPVRRRLDGPGGGRRRHRAAGAQRGPARLAPAPQAQRRRP